MISIKQTRLSLSFILVISILIACGGGGSSTGSTAEPVVDDTPVIESLVLETISIPDPLSYYNDSCEDPSLQFVIPVNINDDSVSDFIVHYWCGQEVTGTVDDLPTPDALVVQLSQPDGSYSVGNSEVLGSELYKLGGASRKYARGDINGDDRDDFAFAMNWEDGRSGADSNTVATEPTVLMSTGDIGYEVVRLGAPSWGHAVDIVYNNDGTTEAVFAGFANNNLQAFRYENGSFTDVSDSYPANAGTWAGAFRAINVNGITEYIAGATTVTDPASETYSVLQLGLKLYKRNGLGWTDLDDSLFDVDFMGTWTSWSLDESPVTVVSFNGEQYFGGDIQEIHTMAPLTENGNPLIVAKIAAAKDNYNRILVVDEVYSQQDSSPVNIYQFFEYTADGLTLIESPIFNEEIYSNFNYFDSEDISGDSCPDLVSYAFTRPGFNERVEEGGKPTVYLNDCTGSLVRIDISDLPTKGGDSEKQSILFDVNSDNVTDLVLFGSSTYSEGGLIDIHLLRNNFSL